VICTYLSVKKDAPEMKANSLGEQARRYFKAMCDNDRTAIALWQRCRELSVERYVKSYARLNIHFDEYLGESQVKPESMEAAEKQMFASNLIEDSEGAKIVDFTKHVPGKEGKWLNKALIRKRNGTSLYLRHEIRALFKRETVYNFD
jgi:arginyl-tRNA synthetase